MQLQQGQHERLRVEAALSSDHRKWRSLRDFSTLMRRNDMARCAPTSRNRFATIGVGRKGSPWQKKCEEQKPAKRHFLAPSSNWPRIEL